MLASKLICCESTRPKRARASVADEQATKTAHKRAKTRLIAFVVTSLHSANVKIETTRRKCVKLYWKICHGLENLPRGQILRSAPFNRQMGASQVLDHRLNVAIVGIVRGILSSNTVPDAQPLTSFCAVRRKRFGPTTDAFFPLK
jgi:hypothetical protein